MSTFTFQLSIMSNGLPNTKVIKFPSKLLLGKDMFTLTKFDPEYETSVSIWYFEMMIVIK